ncbi:MAG: recombinase family protein [Clostridia bacterium]
MNICYLRVSSSTQNILPQRNLFDKYNIEKYFEEKVSGRTMERKALGEMMEFSREGDKIYIMDFSRISRSLKDLLKIIDFFEKKKVAIISLKENLDTSTATGKMMLSVIGAINEFQVNIQREKQKVGIEYAKQLGKYRGRKKIDFPDNWNMVYNQYKGREMTGVEAMKVLNLKKNTFYNLKKEWENQNGN